MGNSEKLLQCGGYGISDGIYARAHTATANSGRATTVSLVLEDLTMACNIYAEEINFAYIVTHTCIRINIYFELV